MISNFELKMLAELAHVNAIAKAQKRRFAQNVKRMEYVTNDECSQFVGREARPCHC